MSTRRVLGLVFLSLAMVTGAAVGDVVTHWNMTAMDFIRIQGLSNHVGNRAMAMMHLAMFDAINGSQQRYTPFSWTKKVPKGLPADAVAAAAAMEVLAGVFPDYRATFVTLYDQQTATLNAGRKRATYVQGLRIAEAMLALRKDDGAAGAGGVPFPDGTQPGQWRRTGAAAPVLPGWGQVTPFCMLSGTQFRLLGPPPLDGYEYARDYNETKEIGKAVSTVRTAEQEDIANFWIMGIPMLWNMVAHQLSESEDYDLLDNARLFALLNVALADAQVVGWDMKYHYGFWRPVTAIRLGDTDGNDATDPDLEWTSLLPAPAFPEYTSGHSTSCSAAATVLATVNGGDSFTFVLTSMATPTLPPRTYQGFWQAAREAGISRIYGGIHFNFSNVEGLEAGRSLGRYICENFMTRQE